MTTDTTETVKGGSDLFHGVSAKQQRAERGRAEESCPFVVVVKMQFLVRRALRNVCINALKADQERANDSKLRICTMVGERQQPRVVASDLREGRGTQHHYWIT